MNDQVTGGPAFPVPIPASGTFTGMSLRDYLASHAPPVPDSFVCRNPAPPERPLAVDAVARNARLRSLISDYRRDPCFELSDCGETPEENADLMAFRVAQDGYADACEVWRRACEVHRLIEWRWFYADMMLAARSKASGPGPVAGDEVRAG